MPSEQDPSSPPSELTRVTPSSRRASTWLMWIFAACLPFLLFLGMALAAALGADDY